MPKKVIVEPDFFARRYNVKTIRSVCECLLDGEAWEFIQGTDFPAKMEVSKFAAHVKHFAKEKGIGVHVKLSPQEKKVTARGYELTEEDLAKRKAISERFTKGKADKKASDRPPAA